MSDMAAMGLGVVVGGAMAAPTPRRWPSPSRKPSCSAHRRCNRARHCQVALSPRSRSAHVAQPTSPPATTPNVVVVTPVARAHRLLARMRAKRGPTGSPEGVRVVAHACGLTLRQRRSSHAVFGKPHWSNTRPFQIHNPPSRPAAVGSFG